MFAAPARRRRVRPDEGLTLAEKVTVRVDLGLSVDGGRDSGAPTLDGDRLAAAMPGYTSVRSYGFGEVYLGARGLAVPSLSAYLASHFRVQSNAEATRPLLDPYDEADRTQTRVAWVESDELFAQRWLAPLRARAGRMYVYGPAIVHLDGLLVAWESSWLQVSAWGGARVADYKTFEVMDPITGDDGLHRQDAVSGTEVRVDLRRFGVPVVASARSLSYLGHDHGELAASLVPRPGSVLRSSARFGDRRLARLRLVGRARVTEDSIVSFDAQYRTREDWLWDYSSLAVVGNPTGDHDLAARRYLDLGEVRPRLLAAVQAGTVLAQNVDLLGRGAVAIDTTATDGELNPSQPEYVEGGAGIEIRLRRALSLASSVLVRDYSRPFPDAFTDEPDVAQPLPPRSQMGEESLVEAGVTARYSGGARRYSIHGEIYWRRTKWAPLFEASPGDVGPLDRHGGGRFSLEAWVSPRVRVRGEYDLSTALDLAPEVLGLKSLRLLLEGTY